MKFFKPEKTKLFWIYIVGGILCAILGVLLMPVWNSVEWAIWKSWGIKSIDILICCCILIYLFGYLLKKIIKHSNSVVKVLTIIEFAVLALVALGSILQQFNIINIGGACTILGLALWFRGVVEVFRAYYHQGGNNKNYPIWWVIISILFITFGAYLFTNPLFTDLHLLWFFVVLILVFAIFLVVVGILAKPKKK